MYHRLIVMMKLCLLVSALALSSSAAGQASIFPQQPRNGETVRLQIPAGAFGTSSDAWDYRSNRVTMVDGRLVVGIVNRGPGNDLPLASPAVDLPLGQFPEGTYQVDVRVERIDRSVITNVGTVSFTVPPRVAGAPIWNLTDLWWNPAEPGWGINLAQRPSGILFATWFVYGSDGKATWYVVPDARSIALGAAFVGPIYRTTGPIFCGDNLPCVGLPFDPSLVTVTQVGQASIFFSSANYDRAQISITVDGKTVTRDIQRQSF